MTDIKTRRDYKDRLFRFIFGCEERKEYTLELYNALNDSSYTNPGDLELTTMDDVIYLNMKNDVSFIIDRRMNLFEQQSTFNPNMPVRGLMYFGKLYDSYIETHDLDIYGTKLVRLPTPRYVVFYIGETFFPGRKVLKLSDALDFPQESDVNVTATMININGDAGDELLTKCPMLTEYAAFIGKVRARLRSGMKRDAAITKAIEECIGENILRDLLLAHKSEVKDMVLTEYNEERHNRTLREEGDAERCRIAARNMHQNGLSDEQIADYLDISLKDVKKHLAAVSDADETGLSNSNAASPA